MKALIVHEALFPVVGYGGTERVVWWLAKGLAELGVDVRLACLPGSRSSFVKLLHPDFRSPLEPQLGADRPDVIHFFNTPEEPLETPHLVTIGGNGRPGERFLSNTVFVSGNHAARHGAECFVHNGIDTDEYEFRSRKEDYLLFLAKASWRVKNVKGAIHIARRSGRPLRVLGGSRWFRSPWSPVRWEGMIDGSRKRELIAGGRALLFPVIWHEPFGLAVVEALASGTPVLATPFGSLPEIVSEDVGRLCRSEAEFVEALAQLDGYSAERCRARASEHFHYRLMAERYRRLYERVIAGERLNAREPRAEAAPDSGCALPARFA